MIKRFSLEIVLSALSLKHRALSPRNFPGLCILRVFTYRLIKGIDFCRIAKPQESIKRRGLGLRSFRLAIDLR